MYFLKKFQVQVDIVQTSVVQGGLTVFDVVYLHSGILLSHKKERNDTICSNMDGPRDYHTE